MKPRLLSSSLTAILPAILYIAGAGCSGRHHPPFVPPPSATQPLDPFWQTCQLKKIILSFPAYALHEESVEEFRQDIEKATVGKDPVTGKEYLDWPGDGCHTSATYILDRTEQTIDIVRHYNGFESIPGSLCTPYRRIGKIWKAEADYPVSGELPHMRIGDNP